MKKNIKLFIAIVVLAGGLFLFFSNTSDYASSIKNNGAVSKVFINNQNKVKKITIDNTGIYDVEFSSDDNSVVSDDFRIPRSGEKLVGQLLKKGDQISIPENSSIDLTPTNMEFNNNNAIVLDNLGTYFVSKQFNPGDYTVDFSNAEEINLKTNDELVELQVTILDKSGKIISETTLNPEKNKINLPSDSIIKIKGSVPITLNKTRT